MIHEKGSIILSGEITRDYCSKIAACPMRRVVQRLSTPGLPKDCRLIPYDLLFVAALLMVWFVLVKLHIAWILLWLGVPILKRIQLAMNFSTQGG